MATSLELQAVQQAILRKKLVAEADLEALSGTTVAQYIEVLVERAETSTEAVLILTDAIEGKVPTSLRLDSLAAFAQAQFDYYSSVLKVANPELGPYEALGRALSSTVGFHAQSDGRSDGQFIVDAWVKANNASPGDTPSQALIQHYQAQISSFTNAYTKAGIAPAEAANQARGAVYGQIFGAAALVEDSPLDTAAENFMRGAVTGAANYDAPLSASQPAAPDPNDQTFALTQQTDSGAAFSGAEGSDTFNAEVIQTAFLPIQTLNNTDNLDGGADRDTLNVQLVNAFTVPAGLKGIEVVNVDGAPGFIVPAVTLDVVNADAIDTLGFRAPVNDVTINNLKTALQQVNISNEPGGTDITINHVGTALDGTADELSIQLNNVGQFGNENELHLKSASGSGYETLSIESIGGVANDFNVDGNAQDAKTVNVTGDTDLNLNSPIGDAWDVAVLDLLDASHFTGKLNTDFSGTGSVQVLGGTNADDLTFDVNVVANASGNGGDDLFTFLSNNGGTATFTKDDKADGGDGTDTLRIQADTGAVLGTGVGPNITTVEIIQHVTNGAASGNISADLSRQGSAKIFELAGDYNGFDVSVTNIDGNGNVGGTDDTVLYSGSGIDDLTLAHTAPGVLFDEVTLKLTNSADVETDLIVASSVDLLHIDVATAAGQINRIDGVDQVNTNIQVTGSGELHLGLNNGDYDLDGGVVDASAFTGVLQIQVGDGNQTVIGGSGNDLVIVDESDNTGDADVVNLTAGGSDTVRFTEEQAGAGSALGNGSYHHVTGFSVANDLIQVDASNLSLDTTTGAAVAAGNTVSILNYVAGTTVDGDAQTWNFIKFTTAVDTAGDTAQTAWDEAISNGQIQDVDAGDTFLAAFYDQTNSQMVLMTVDENQGPFALDDGDDVDVVATVSMSYTDFLAFNGTNIAFV